MKSKIIASLTLCALLFAACHTAPVKDRDTQAQEIAQLEQQLQWISIDESQADSLIGLYNAFISQFPDDSLAAGFLLKAGQIMTNIGLPDSSIQYYDQIIDNYPDFDQLAECYFYKAYAYEQGEHYEEAQEAYTYFADTYPDNVLAAGLKSSVIPNLGKMSDLVEHFAQDPNNQNVPMEEI